MSVNLRHRVHLIEMKLKYQSPPPNRDEYQFLKQIVELFGHVWKLSKEYPEVNSELGVDIFRGIFDEMSSDYRGTSSKVVVLTCDYCDMEFPLLNNDAEFSFQMHAQTPEHVKAVDDFEILRSPLPVPGVGSNATPPDNLPKSLGPQPRKFVPTSSAAGSDKWIQTRGDSKYCVLCNTKLPGASQLRQHLMGQKHQTACKSGAASPSAKNSSTEANGAHKMAVNSGNSIDNGTTSLMSLIYRSNAAVRLAYFLNKAFIFRSPASPKFSFCGLCGVLVDPTQAEEHALTTKHKDKVNEIVGNSDAKLVSFEVGILPGDNGKKNMHRKCHMCDVILPENNPHNYDIHLENRTHQENIRAHFKSSRFKEWERGIILRHGYPYCVLCRLILPTEFTMQKHIRDPAHTTSISK